MGGIHHVTPKHILGSLFIVAILLLPFGLQSCAMGNIHIPLFPMQMDAGAMQQCTSDIVTHLQQLDQLFGSLVITDSLLGVFFCILLCLARERKRLFGIADHAVTRMRSYARLTRSFPHLHLPFFSFERVALPGLMPYKHPAFS